MDKLIAGLLPIQMTDRPEDRDYLPTGSDSWLFPIGPEVEGTTRSKNVNCNG